MANTPVPVQVDYTSRDYLSLREDMISRVKATIPEWNSADPTDFGVVLVEAFAYMGDMLSYYIDRAANEASLATATRRNSVVAIARDLGYEPNGYTPSKVFVTFTNEDTENAVTIFEGTLLSASVDSGDTTLDIPFETLADVTVPAGGTATVECVQGETRIGDGYGESLGTSDGQPRQVFELPDDKIIKESVVVYVFDGVNFFPWQRVEHLVDHAPMSRVFSVTDTGSSFYVEFGDGISGMIPSLSHVIYAEYRVVDGLDGNVPAGTITEITSIPGLTDAETIALTGVVTVTNDAAASGGTDPEELESIRYSAAQAYRTASRAVTLEDYQNIALGVEGCGKASAMSDVPGVVVLAVAPYRNTSAAELTPGFDRIAITAVDDASPAPGSVTFTTDAPTGLSVGDIVTITGATAAAFNLPDLEVSAVNDTTAPYTFTVLSTATGATSTATGLVVSSTMSDLKTRVAAEIESNSLVGTTTTVVNPVYSYIQLSINIEALESIRSADATTIVTQALLDRFDYQRVGFGATVYETDIISLVASLGVAKSISVTTLKRPDDVAEVADLVAADDEILLLIDADLTVVATGGA